jgi:hypothetical protein
MQIGLFLFFVESPKVAKASTVTCRCRWCYCVNLLPKERHLKFVLDNWIGGHMMSSLKNSLPVESTTYWLSPVLQEEVLSGSGNKGCWQE